MKRHLGAIAAGVAAFCDMLALAASRRFSPAASAEGFGRRSRAACTVSLSLPAHTPLRSAGGSRVLSVAGPAGLCPETP